MNAAVHVLGKLLLTSRPVAQHDPDRHGTLKGQKYLQRRRRAASRVHGANGGCLPAGCSLPVWSRPGWLGPAPQHCAVQHRGCNAGPLAPQGLGSGSCHTTSVVAVQLGIEPLQDANGLAMRGGGLPR